MDVEKITEILLIVFAFLIITYNLIINIGTECFDKVSMIMSVFALIYSAFLRMIK